MEERFRAMASRRGLITRSAALTGAAAVTMGVTPHVARAIEDPSQSKLKQILDAGKLRVGTGSTNPPWHFEDENGKLVGFDIEMAKLVAGGLFGLSQEQVLGDEEPRKHIEFVVHEADARIPDLLADKVDVNFQFMTVTSTARCRSSSRSPTTAKVSASFSSRTRPTTPGPTSRARARQSRFCRTSTPRRSSTAGSRTPMSSSSIRLRPRSRRSTPAASTPPPPTSRPWHGSPRTAATSTRSTRTAGTRTRTLPRSSRATRSS